MKKVKVFLLMILGVLLVITGCSNENIGEDSLDISKLIMGMDDTFAPMGFRDKQGEIIGFDVDLAKEVFKRMDVDYELQAIDWSMKETELSSKNIDMIWNGYSITDKRKEKVNFSQAYLENKQIIVTLSDTNIFEKEDLNGKKVAVQNGSSTLEAINKEPEIVETFENGEPILFDTNHEAFLDLEAGRSDVVVADEVLARYYIKQKNADDYRVLEEDFGKEEYGIGFRKEDEELLEKVNKVLDDMREDGTYDSIYQKWFN